MKQHRNSIILAALLLGGCASHDNLAGQRTVFSNPYAPAALDRTGIGPQCEVALGRDSTCLDPRFIVGRRGRIAILQDGRTVRLTRAQRDVLRERAELREALRRQPTIPPPPPTADPAP